MDQHSTKERGQPAPLLERAQLMLFASRRAVRVSGCAENAKWHDTPHNKRYTDKLLFPLPDHVGVVIIVCFNDAGGLLERESPASTSNCLKTCSRTRPSRGVKDQMAE
jgi:hypothetical protein